jgi:hypothetical protein
MKKTLFYLFILSTMIGCFGCAKEDSGSSSSNNSEVKKDFKIGSSLINESSNLKDTEFLIKTKKSSNNLFSLNLFSENSEVLPEEEIQGLTLNNEVISLFDKDNGVIDSVKKNGDYILYKGVFEVTSYDGVSYNCLLVFEFNEVSNCLIPEHEDLKSFGYSFLKKSSTETSNDAPIEETIYHDINVALIFIDLASSGEKILYEFDLNSNFNEMKEFKVDVNLQDLIKIDYDSTIINSYSGGSYVSFELDKGDEKRIVSFKKINEEYHGKDYLMTSDSMMNIDGENYFMSNGDLRNGWNKSINYHSSSNNRDFSKDAMIVSSKDGFFPMFYQNDYKVMGFSDGINYEYTQPELLYFSPKRNDLPDHYPDKVYQTIYLTTKNNPESTTTAISPIGWQKARGYKKYAMAYGIAVKSYYDGYQLGGVDIPKALILIDTDKKRYPTEGNPDLEVITLYNYEDPSDPVDNLLQRFGFDSVTEIENYINGFKITGLESDQEKVVFYNPYDDIIETPTNGDEISFIIQERL